MPPKCHHDGCNKARVGYSLSCALHDAMDDLACAQQDLYKAAKPYSDALQEVGRLTVLVAELVREDQAQRDEVATLESISLG